MKQKSNSAIKSIVILFLLGLGVFSCSKTDNPTPPPTPPPPASTLTIIKFDTLSVGDVSAKMVWKDSGNSKITSRTITNNTSGEVIDVFSSASYEAKNLKPGTFYSFILKVKDATGNMKSATLGFYTKLAESKVFSIEKVSLDKEFAIIGNCQSDTLRLKIKNLSSVNKVLKFLSGSFGVNGVAVKMLRYRPTDTSAWKILPAKNGIITFENLMLSPGENDLKSLFSIKAYPGVADDAPLTFTFISMDDGEGGGIPKGGFPASISAGKVNSHTMPTTYTGEFGWRIESFIGGISFSSGGSGSGPVHTVNDVRLSGPGPAKLISLRLKNPYASFTGMEWGYADPNNDFHRWTIAHDDLFKRSIPRGKYNGLGGCSSEITNFYWQGDYINLAFADGCNFLNMYIPGGSNQIVSIGCGMKNHSNTIFESNDYTPGLFGFILASKFDFVLENSDGQIVDFSDALVTQDQIPLNN